jgi:hypothetical protein
MTNARRSARRAASRWGFIVDEDGTTRDVCLECGFSDEMTLLRATDG